MYLVYLVNIVLVFLFPLTVVDFGVLIEAG